jgi:hypothetical protein
MKARMKWEWLVPLTRYTEFWRQARKLLDRGLRTGALAVYRPVLETKAHILLVRLLENPDMWEAHIEQFVIFLLPSFRLLTIFPTYSLIGELILAIGYGYEVQGHNDRTVNVARKIAELGSETALPGALLVNVLPFRECSLSSWTHLA